MHEFRYTKPFPDAPGDDWTVLHGAALARLTQLAAQCRQRSVSAGVLECVHALRGLQALRARGAVLQERPHDERGAAP